MTIQFRSRCLVVGALFIFAITPIIVAAPPTAVSSAQVKVSGVTTLFGDKRAILVITEPGQSSKDSQSCVLKEGETSGSIKVLQIDVDAGRVRIENGGKQSEISFSQNGIAPPVAPPIAPRASTAALELPVAVPPPSVAIAQEPTEVPPPQPEFESQPQTDIPDQMLVIGRQRDRVAAQSADPSALGSQGGLTRGIPPVKQFGRPVANTPRDLPMPDMSSLPEFMTNRYGAVMDGDATLRYPVPAPRGFMPRQPSTPVPTGPLPTATSGGSSSAILIQLQREQSFDRRAMILPPTRFSREAAPQ